MRKKIILTTFVLLLLLSRIISSVVYAINDNNATNADTKKNSYFTIDLKEVSPGESFNLSIDLSKINYNDIEISLISNLTFAKVYSENSKVEFTSASDTNDCTIIVHKKDLNSNKILLNYTVPKETALGTTITFSGTISPYVEEDISDTEILDTDIFKETVSIEIKSIVENDDNNKNEYDNSSSNTETTKPNESNVPNTNIQSTKTDFSTTQQSTQNINAQSNQLTQKNSTLSGSNTSNSLGSTTETVTYNGSCNNYLSTLSVNNFTFTKDFSKTNTTYFVTVDSSTTSIHVNYTVEDSNSTVCVYGNTNLQSGINKVLVSVTAQNGNVKTYRIYVTT